MFTKKYDPFSFNPWLFLALVGGAAAWVVVWDQIAGMWLR